MMGKQQTAVEWLWAKATNGYLSPEDFEQAKLMEREHIEKAVIYGNRHDSYDGTETLGDYYYTQTYGE